MNIQTAKRMRHVMSPVACPTVQYFPTLSHKRHDFGEKVIEYEMCVLIFSTTFVQNISRFKKNSASHCHKLQ